MQVLNYGSLNIDYVYGVDRVAGPGETVAAATCRTFPGGKGANQSVALARAGARVAHAGKIAADGDWLLDRLNSAGVDTGFVSRAGDQTGHAVIQVDAAGENAIVVYAGANAHLARSEIDAVFERTPTGTTLLLQNEVNEVPYLLAEGRRRGFRTCFNPAPFTAAVRDYPLDAVDILVVNESEGRGLTGEEGPDAILAALRARYAAAELVVTLGAAGVVYASATESHRLPAERVAAVDTTAAGDCFIGYFLAGVVRGETRRDSLAMAARAAAVCVQSAGAMDSIPVASQVVPA